MLEKLETSPILRNRLINTMIQYLNGSPSVDIPLCEVVDDQTVNYCFEMQHKIGIRNKFRGLLCKQISDMQQKWYRHNQHKKRNNIAKWDVTVRAGLINICKVIHDENKLTIDGFTRSSAYDLHHKLQ